MKQRDSALEVPTSQEIGELVIQVVRNTLIRHSQPHRTLSFVCREPRWGWQRRQLGGDSGHTPAVGNSACGVADATLPSVNVTWESKANGKIFKDL